MVSSAYPASHAPLGAGGFGGTELGDLMEFHWEVRSLCHAGVSPCSCFSKDSVDHRCWGEMCIGPHLQSFVVGTQEISDVNMSYKSNGSVQIRASLAPWKCLLCACWVGLRADGKKRSIWEGISLGDWALPGILFQPLAKSVPSLGPSFSALKEEVVVIDDGATLSGMPLELRQGSG